MLLLNACRRTRVPAEQTSSEQLFANRRWRTLVWRTCVQGGCTADLSETGQWRSHSILGSSSNSPRSHQHATPTRRTICSCAVARRRRLADRQLLFVLGGVARRRGAPGGPRGVPASAPAAQPVQSAPHVVQPGDTLWSISQRVPGRPFARRLRRRSASRRTAGPTSRSAQRPGSCPEPAAAGATGQASAKIIAGQLVGHRRRHRAARRRCCARYSSDRRAGLGVRRAPGARRRAPAAIRLAQVQVQLHDRGAVRQTSPISGSSRMQDEVAEHALVATGVQRLGHGLQRARTSARADRRCTAGSNGRSANVQGGVHEVALGRPATIDRRQPDAGRSATSRYAQAVVADLLQQFPDMGEDVVATFGGEWSAARAAGSPASRDVRARSWLRALLMAASVRVRVNSGKNSYR